MMRACMKLAIQHAPLPIDQSTGAALPPLLKQFQPGQVIPA
jgi:hypothetical protein